MSHTKGHAASSDTTRASRRGKGTSTYTSMGGRSNRAARYGKGLTIAGRKKKKKK